MSFLIAYLMSLPFGFCVLFYLYKRDMRPSTPGPIMSAILAGTALIACPIWPLILLALTATGTLKKIINKEFGDELQEG